MTDPRTVFAGNLRFLQNRDRELAERIAGAQPDFSTPLCYRFLEARNGDPVPAILGSGTARPLHSLVDPRREGIRLVSTLGEEDFLIFLGLGGGYHIEAALERPETSRVIIVEYGIRGLAELLGLRDLGRILGDSRVGILADPPSGMLERFIPAHFLPALSGAIRVLPLRPRIDAAPLVFETAAAEIREAVGRVSADYSVQAHFGIRMFKNILRNILIAETIPAEEGPAPFPRIDRALICAAGPSLNSRLAHIAESREKGGLLIAADTSLPVLLSAGLKPDATVSIDCQHISYRHFIPPGTKGGDPGLLFLDLTSPLGSLAGRRIFFSGGHPLADYASSWWRPFPSIDSSGGNVTYAAVSLAEFLGAGEIRLYGADFSYPQGSTYARGTYIFPYFNMRQNRLYPLESLFSHFLYRGPLEKKNGPGGAWYYETAALARYREALALKGERMGARPLPEGGFTRVPRRGLGDPRRGRAAGKNPILPARDFLAEYRERIRALPPPREGPASAYPEKLDVGERQILATLLPLAAALRRRDPGLRGAGIIEGIRDYGIAAIDRVLG
ncbi:MAG: DUF115 domain-containing protein [Treponema sp.]|jgi:hypothetical protein|nr:DUF115 domain-containing protein [Treponema sp.]